jgi:uncharacterized protein YegJ (DUF2314 family)
MKVTHRVSLSRTQVWLCALTVALAACRSRTSSSTEPKKLEEQAGNVVERSTEDPELAAASARARATLGDFRAALEKPHAAHRSFAVKVAIREADRVEHLWISDVKAKGRGFQGVIDNVPVDLTKVRLGDVREVREEEVEDWTYFDGEERRGGETIRVLLLRKREGELRDIQGKCATKDYAEACFDLGDRYLKGNEVEKLPEIAFRLFALSCDGGSARGCNSAGWSKARGRGTVRNDAEAGAFFARACPSGEEDPAACDSRGFALVTGFGATQRDVAQGKRLLERACSRNMAESCLMLELMRRRGLAHGTPEAKTCGADFSALEEGCTNGDTEACLLVSGILEHGLCSVRSDKVRAKALSDLAARGGAGWPAAASSG